MLCQTIPLGTLLSVLVLQISTKVAAQPQCDGLSLLAGNAEQSQFLSSCARDVNCTFIQCSILDPQTQNLQINAALLRVLPCATPMAQVEFQLLNLTSGVVRYSQMVNRSSDIDITIFSETAGLDIHVGTLMTFINHTSNSIGLRMELFMTTTRVSLFAYTNVPLDLSACPAPPPTTSITSVTETTASTTDTSVLETTTNRSVNLSISMWLTITLTSLLLLVCV